MKMHHFFLLVAFIMLAPGMSQKSRIGMAVLSLVLSVGFRLLNF